MANVSKPISIPNEEFSDDTTPSVARKFLNEVKSTIVTLQRVVKQKMTLDIHNWPSSVHQEIHKIIKDEIFPIVNQVDARLQNFKIQFLKEAVKFVRDFKSLAKEADESLAKHKAWELEIERLLRAVVSQDIMSIVQTYNDMQQKIKRLQAQLGDQKGKSKDTPCVLNTLEPLSQKLENENVEVEFQLRAQLFDKVSEQKDTTEGTSVNTQFCKQSILGKPPSSSGSKIYDVTPFPKSKGLPNIDKTHALIYPFKPSREEKYVPNKVRASIRTNPITVSQLYAITKKDVNSDSNGLSSTGVDNTTKTRRPQPRSNTKNDKVPSASKSSCSKNKEVENDKSEVICAMCKQCLITANHDKQKSKVMKPKKVGSNERLASPKPSKPRSCLRWSPTGRLFDLKGKIIASSESESQSDCSISDNACTSNPPEPTIKQFPNPTSFLGRLSKFFLGTVRFGNHHVAAILGFGDLQWGNILITRVYFVEGLGYNLFSVGQFCDSDLEHQRLSHLNFDTINDLAKNDLVTGLPKFKYHKEHLCPSCEKGKSKRASHPPKPVLNSKQRLHILHMDLCSPIRITSINGKRYVLVIVDDYSSYTWVHFLKLKDETPEVIKTFLKRITILLQFPVIIIRTDNGTEFKNQILKEYFDSVGISHQTSYVRTPQQNRVVERRNRTLVEAARTMLIFSCAPLFLWAKAIATACYTLCYPKNDREDIGKLGAKGDIGFFIGYSVDSCAYRVYNRRTKKIMERMNVTFDELSAMAFEQSTSKPELQGMTSGQISSGLDLTYAPSTITTQQPTKAAPRTTLAAQAPQVLQTPTATTTTADTAPTLTNSSSQATNFPNTSQDVDELETQQHVQHQPATIADNVPNAIFDENTFVNPFATPSTSAAESSSSQYVDPLNMHTFYQPYPHEYQWTKDHPLEQVIGEPSRPVLTRNQLRSDDDMCMYALTVSTMEPKNVKEAMTDPAWIESMQEELLQFKRLDVWV
ncbi:retrovirus-related pol polyprotein from transposon TNT 1-94 [Tanacetum coccineum]|uniref:Retrovirus-related pol polyprotein from transposon TNT 1-94 n=1 Tax=Tanacetum coccineum TaxID=301880 RepID=A0ABQ5J7J0_9ASTR